MPVSWPKILQVQRAQPLVPVGSLLNAHLFRLGERCGAGAPATAAGDPTGWPLCGDRHGINQTGTLELSQTIKGERIWKKDETSERTTFSNYVELEIYL